MMKNVLCKLVLFFPLFASANTLTPNTIHFNKMITSANSSHVLSVKYQTDKHIISNSSSNAITSNRNKSSVTFVENMKNLGNTDDTTGALPLIGTALVLFGFAANRKSI